MQLSAATVQQEIIAVNKKRQWCMHTIAKEESLVRQTDAANTLADLNLKLATLESTLRYLMVEE